MPAFLFEIKDLIILEKCIIWLLSISFVDSNSPNATPVRSTCVFSTWSLSLAKRPVNYFLSLLTLILEKTWKLLEKRIKWVGVLRMIIVSKKSKKSIEMWSWSKNWFCSASYFASLNAPGGGWLKEIKLIGFFNNWYNYNVHNSRNSWKVVILLKAQISCRDNPKFYTFQLLLATQMFMYSVHRCEMFSTLKFICTCTLILP